jgi:cytochrome c biogenesis protein CcmG, thiol:disulfide interchange protein DsbE
MSRPVSLCHRSRHAPTGRILWYYDPSTSGWLTVTALAQHVRAALTSAPGAPVNAPAAQQELAGSPPVLAALHQQADQLLGGGSAFAARLRALRGYPIVVNAWASWCTPCRKEFGLFAFASARYGRQVAFLGADAEDSPGDARSFLAQHPVSYPSYQTTASGPSSLASIAGLPTTIFSNRAGKVVHVHRPVRGAGDARRRHQQLRARRLRRGFVCAVSPSAEGSYGSERNNRTAGRRVPPTWKPSHIPFPISLSSTRQAIRKAPGLLARNENVAERPGARPTSGSDVAAPGKAGPVDRLLSTIAHECRALDTVFKQRTTTRQPSGTCTST